MIIVADAMIQQLDSRAISALALQHHEAKEVDRVLDPIRTVEKIDDAVVRVLAIVKHNVID